MFPHSKSSTVGTVFCHGFSLSGFIKAVQNIRLMELIGAGCCPKGSIWKNSACPYQQVMKKYGILHFGTPKWRMCIIDIIFNVTLKIQIKIRAIFKLVDTMMSYCYAQQNQAWLKAKETFFRVELVSLRRATLLVWLQTNRYTTIQSARRWKIPQAEEPKSNIWSYSQECHFCLKYCNISLVFTFKKYQQYQQGFI